MITVTNLRKIFTEQGIKGASNWKREDFESTIIAAEFAAHEQDAEMAPKVELNLAKLPARSGRSRAGMVIVAKGSEIHKSNTFKVAAEAAGWTVTMASETYELPEGTTGDGTRYYATATKGDDSISLAWDGRAYDYPASSAQLNGKGRKVRNLKEALRLL